MESRPPIRMTADIDGDFVVFMTGTHIHRLWKVHKWWGNFTGMMSIMPILQKEEYGFLGCHYWVSLRGVFMVAYFRSFEQLEHLANDPNAPHTAVWRNFFKRMGKSGDVGLWHETFLVRAGEYEAAYSFMAEPTGLGAATASKWVPVSAKGDKAKERRNAHAKAKTATGDGAAATSSRESAGVPAGELSPGSASIRSLGRTRLKTLFYMLTAHFTWWVAMRFVLIWMGLLARRDNKKAVKRK